jgi:hypothetical protein
VQRLHPRVTPECSWGYQWALGVPFLAGVYVAALRTAWHGTARAPRVSDRAAEQRDAADEGRLDPCGSIIVGPAIMNEGKVVRPSQLIASVRRT